MLRQERTPTVAALLFFFVGESDATSVGGSDVRTVGIGFAAPS